MHCCSIFLKSEIISNRLIECILEEKGIHQMSNRTQCPAILHLPLFSTHKFTQWDASLRMNPTGYIAAHEHRATEEPPSADGTRPTAERLMYSELGSSPDSIQVFSTPRQQSRMILKPRDELISASHITESNLP